MIIQNIYIFLLQYIFQGGINLGTSLLRCFYSDTGKELTIKDIIERSGLTYKPVYFGLMKLMERDYLNHRREKWKHFFSLNLSNTFVRKELELIEVERREKFLNELEEKQRRALDRLVESVQEKIPLLMVRLINPVAIAQGKIELLFVVAETDDYGNTIKNFCNGVEVTHGVTIAPVTASLKVFRRILAEESNLRRMIESGVTFFGTEFFIREKIRSAERETMVEKGTTSSRYGATLYAPPAPKTGVLHRNESIVPGGSGDGRG
jgi:hypothetical protein